MIVLLDADDGKIEEYAALTRKNKADYAHKWGYINYHVHLAEQPNLSVEWSLVHAIREALRLMVNEGDWLFFSGADALFVNFDYPLERIVTDYAGDFDLLITRDENGLNTNGFLLCNNAWGREFIEKVWALRGQTFEVKSNGQTHVWKEQGAFIEVLKDPEMKKHVRFIPQELTNGYYPAIYGPQYKEPVCMAHFPGKSTSERAAWIRELTAEVKI